MTGSLYSVSDPEPEPRASGTIPVEQKQAAYLALVSCNVRSLYGGPPPAVTMLADWERKKDETATDPYLVRIVEYEKDALLFGSQTYVLSTTTGAAEGYAGVVNQPTTARPLSLTFPVTATLFEITGTANEYHLFYLDRNIVADVYGLGVDKVEVISKAVGLYTEGQTCEY